MIVELLRHGRTVLQKEGRYVGRTDDSLSAAGAGELLPAACVPSVACVSSRRRTAQTAEIVFPGARQLVVPGLEEMDFGRFEGHSFAELEHDEDYQAWVAGGCVGVCPGGEGKAAFDLRVAAAFAQLMHTAVEHGEDRLTVVAHGGTIMAVLARWGRPQRDYFDWHVGYGCGYLLDAAHWTSERTLHLLAEVKHTRP